MQKRGHEDAEHDSGPQPQAARIAKIRACAECKKHKIRCEPVSGEEKCSKCLRSGLDCYPHNPLQRWQDEDALWKEEATAEIAQLRSAVRVLLRHNQLPDLSSKAEPVPATAPTVVVSPTNASENGARATMLVPPMDMTRENSVEPGEADEESNLVPAPMRSLYDLTRIRTLRSSNRRESRFSSLDEDFIAQGVVSSSDAQELFDRYARNMHRLMWDGMLVPHASLDAVRRHSTLLAAAVLTVAALHTTGSGETLLKCYNVFVTLASSTCLSRLHSLDDVRALCLAAFHLPNLSWKLSGLAVRHAVEMGLHQSYNKLVRGYPEQRESVRLWYALYVCDHQFSIAYGRPPLLRDDVAIQSIEEFLESPQATPGEIRLCAQVALFRILTEAYNTFGGDPEQPLVESDFQQLRMFNFGLEQWRLSWQARSPDSPVIGSYPSKGAVLYYHFARFQLNSLALRALPPPSAASSETLSYDRREAANIAISAATSTLAIIFEEPDLRRAMTAVPIFTHAMVAFCATFLLKMARTWGGVAQTASPEWTAEPVGLGLNFNIGQVLLLSRRSASLLEKVSQSLNEKHLTRHIVWGIYDLLKHFDAPDIQASPIPEQSRNTSETRPLEPQVSVNTGVGPLNDYNMYDLIGSYGFGFDESFLGPVASSDFDLWLS